MKRKFLITILLAMGLEVAAQSHSTPLSVGDNKPTNSVAQSYADSLQMLRDSLFMPKKQKLTSVKVSDANHMRLLFPLTFYRDVTQQLFSNADAERDFNANLMHLYLFRPLKSLTSGLTKATMPCSSCRTTCQETGIEGAKATMLHVDQWLCRLIITINKR